MKKILDFLVKSIVDHPEDIEIKEDKSGQELVLNLKANPEDIKIIIGKDGKTIRAIREIIKIKAIQQKVKVNINITQ